MMKCVVCHGEDIREQHVEDIREQHVDEEMRSGKDIVLAPVTCLVCQTCGERYFDTPTMRRLETLRAELRSGTIPLKQIGKVLAIDPVFAKAA